MTLRDEFEKAMAPLLNIWCGMNSDPSMWHKRPDRSYLNGLLEQHFATYQAAHAAQQRRLEELEALNAKLAKFVDYAIETAFDGAGLDGGTIQDWLEADGFLVRRPELVVPCGGSCACMEDLGEGQKCDSLFRSAELLKALSATAREG